MGNQLRSFTYDEPLIISFRVSATALQTPAEKGRFRGPVGKKGRLISVQGSITTTVTTGAAPLKIGSATDDDAYLTSSVPVGTAPLGFNVSQTALEAGGAVDEIPADSDVVLTAGGTAGAGAADIWVTIAWY